VVKIDAQELVFVVKIDGRELVFVVKFDTLRQFWG
jgi:hypothetical protein